jgi:hypothetical protein
VTPCDDCGRHHFGLTCDGAEDDSTFDVDDAIAECASCGWGSRSTERCTFCAAEEVVPTALACVVMPALDELMWRRRLDLECEKTLEADHAARPTVAVVGAYLSPVEAPRGPASISTAYAAVSRVGALALLGWSLGSLAPLAALLGGL